MLRGKHNLEVEEEVLKDDVKKGLLQEAKRNKNILVVKVEEEEMDLVEAEDSEEERAYM
jgi:hypothetical protein